MKPLNPLGTSNSDPLPIKTNPQTAGHWLSQLIGLFPPIPVPGLSEERKRGMIMIFTQYPESTLKEIVSPTSGMPSCFNYLPTIMEFGTYCADKASELERSRKAVEQFQRIERTRHLPEPETHQQASQSYTGPIEDIRPGDILSWDRMEEYRTFMAQKHGMRNIKHWGFFEEWRDSGARPFATNSQSQLAKPSLPPEEPNPFEAPQ